MAKKPITTSKSTAQQTKCKECGAIIKILEKAELNEIVRCIDCGAEFEIISLKPLKLDEAPIEEEDWGE